MPTDEELNTKDDETLGGNLLKWYLKRHHYL